MTAITNWLLTAREGATRVYFTGLTLETAHDTIRRDAAILMAAAEAGAVYLTQRRVDPAITSFDYTATAGPRHLRREADVREYRKGRV